MLVPGLQSFMHSLFVSSIKLYSSSCTIEDKKKGTHKSKITAFSVGYKYII